MNRTTETLFLRLDPALVRTVRELAKSRKLAISALAEEALQVYVSDSTSADHRAKLLQATEEALLARVEARFGSLARNIQGLYAKEAIDAAMGVELLKQVLALGVREDRQLKSVIQNARQEAHRRVSSRSSWTGPVPPEVEAKLDQVEQEKRKLHEEIYQLKARVGQLEGNCDAYRRGQEELRSELARERKEGGHQLLQLSQAYQRLEWAVQRYEAQGMLKRKSIQEFLADYDRR